MKNIIKLLFKDNQFIPMFSTDEKLSQIFSNKNNYLVVYIQPLAGTNKNGYDTDCTQTVLMTVDDCINAQRNSMSDNQQITVPEKDLFLDFVTVHWAHIVKIK